MNALVNDVAPVEINEAETLIEALPEGFFAQDVEFSEDPKGN